MTTAWESEFAKFLTDLSAVQAESLEIAHRKRELLVAADSEGLAEIAEREKAPHPAAAGLSGTPPPAACSGRPTTGCRRKASARSRRPCPAKKNAAGPASSTRPPAAPACSSTTA